MTESQAAAGSTSLDPAALSFKKNRSLKEQIIGAVLFACAAASTLVTVGIVVVLLRETLSFFAEVSIVEFLTNTQWTPQYTEKNFGILPLAAGSRTAGTALTSIQAVNAPSPQSPPTLVAWKRPPFRH